MDMTVLGNGWTKIWDGPKLGEFWLTGFPLIEDSDDREARQQRESGRYSPILAAGNGGGIGVAQWVNYTHDRAAILIPPAGGWKEGGYFSAWISPGMEKLPIKIDVPVKLEAQEPGRWTEGLAEAIEYMEKLLGIPSASA